MSPDCFTEATVFSADVTFVLHCRNQTVFSVLLYRVNSKGVYGAALKGGGLVPPLNSQHMDQEGKRWRMEVKALCFSPRPPFYKTT